MSWSEGQPASCPARCRSKQTKGGARLAPPQALATPKVYFESIDFAAAEDAKRVELLHATAHAYKAPCKDIRRSRARVQKAARFGTLAEKLQTGVEGDIAPTLASSTAMRELRATIVQALIVAIGNMPFDELRTFTVIKRTWRISPRELARTSAAALKREFMNDLRNAGVFDVPGFFVAFLHGEYDPISGTYQLHFHGVTTREKAQRLLAVKKVRGYGPTVTRAPAVRCVKVRDLRRQLSYCLKAYWPQRPIVEIGGKLKRGRKGRRIGEPNHSAVLLWLDQQRLLDLTITNGTWSRRSGGSAEWMRFNLIAEGWGRSVGSKG